MQNELDVKLCLNVFNKVINDGEKTGDEFHWQGFSAWHDFDGYTCYLKFNQVVVTLMFHGKYATEFPNEDAWQQFIKKLSHLRDSF